MTCNELTNLCTYRVRPGAREAFLKLLKNHWTVLHENGLATDTPAVIFEAHAEDDDAHKESGTTFVEIFSWSSTDAPDLAHRTAAVMSIWEPMGGLVEDRDGRPGMEFPMYRQLNLEQPG